MMNERMQGWDAADFGRHFREAARGAEEGGFREHFDGLAEALEPLDREFLRETSACAIGLGRTMEQLQEIAARQGYCERERGFQQECADLYRQVDEVAASVRALRQGCFV